MFSRRLISPFILLAFIVPSFLWTNAPTASMASSASLPIPSQSDAPVVSALVAIEGPSVYQALVVRGAPADRVNEWVAKLGQPAGAYVNGRSAGDGLGGAGISVKALDADVRRSQEPVVRAAEQLGARVISRYTTVANGLLVHATAAQLAGLAKVKGVQYIEAAPIVRPDLSQSRPHIGATRLANEKGYDGTGTVAAVIDTGVDYTHAFLGGPGTAAAYQAASRPGMTEVITDTYEGKLLFPNDKVIGGWDFVGPRYDPPHICTNAMMAAGTCTNIPEPDPDPLDGSGHGTHTSGIVAGHGVAAIGEGIAPGAKLVMLKLYGTQGADEAADVLIDAIEWCARVNLKLETRGTLPPQVDSINISLGEDNAQGSRMFEQAVQSAVGSGIVIAASAGNSGDRPFVVGVPSASAKVLSVASSVPPSMVLYVTAHWVGSETGDGSYPAVESTIGQSLASAGPIVDAELAWFGPGCNTDTPVQDVKEKVALVARGTCVFSEKLLNAQKAGAVAVLMFTNENPKGPMGGDGTGITIPAVMIDNAPGLELQKKLEALTKVTVTIDGSKRVLDETSADAISGYSSRGPSKNGALKPDITAPGSTITSAAMGTGSGGVAFSGTSMAGPHVAGTGALMQHRNRAEKLGLSAAELSAMLMNYSKPVVFQGLPTNKTMVSVARQGAGEVDVWRAGTAKLVVQTGDIASINLGPLALIRPWHSEQTLKVHNLDSQPAYFTVSAAILTANDRDQGVTIQTPNEPIRVDALGRASAPVTFDVDPAHLRPWNLRPAAGADVGPVNLLEIDGYVTVTPCDATGKPLADQPVASVPFYTLPRRASAVAATALAAAKEAPAGPLHLVNSAPFDGEANLFVAPKDSRTGADSEDPNEPDVLYELDLRRVGVRFEAPTAAEPNTMLTFAFADYETAAIPQVTNYEVYLDTDGNGKPDYRVRDGAQGDRKFTSYAPWNAATGTIVGPELITGTKNVADLHTHLRLLSVPIGAVGMTAPTAFDFFVIHRGLNEDWLFTPDTDVAPDGADATGKAAGPHYRFDPDELARVPDKWTVNVPGSGSADVAFTRGPGEVDVTWLAFFADNSFEDGHGQIQVVRPGGNVPDEHQLLKMYLPWVEW